MQRIIVVPMRAGYPFGDCQQETSTEKKILVKRVLQFRSNPEVLLEKINILRKLQHPSLIKVESLFESEEAIEIIYEYVPIRLQTWLASIDDSFLKKFSSQMEDLAEYLASCGIHTDLLLGNVGMDEDYQAKYFLDIPAFSLQPNTSKETLQRNYSRQIFLMFRKNQDVAISGQKISSQSFVKPSQTYEMNSNASPRKQMSVKSSASNICSRQFVERLEDIKQRMKAICMPLSSSHTHRNSTSRNSTHRNSSTQKNIRTKAGNQSFAIRVCADTLKQIAFHDTKRASMKGANSFRKNEMLKQREYGEIIQSDRNYVEDFFRVLEGKPISDMTFASLLPIAKAKPHKSVVTMATVPSSQKTLSSISELEKRVRAAINKSKDLIDRFKAGKK